ncbi:MAG: TRAP transporter substrate-binding protein [Reyranellaceae bacterium]
MKQGLFGLLLGAAVLGLSGAAVQAQDLPETKLSVVGAIGIHPQYQNYEKPFWTDRIAQRSNGKVTVAVKPWTELGLKGPEVLKLVQRGNFQIGTVNLPYNSGESAFVDAHDLPGLAPGFDDLKKVTAAWRPVLSEVLEKEFGVKVLAMFSYSAQVLYCRDEFRSIADIKGRKVRTSGAAQANFVESLGGAGINVNFGEVQQALDRGVIDCAITGAYSGYSAKWYESSKFVSPLAINWGVQAVVANIAAWNKLDPKVRDFIAAEIKTFEGEVVALAERETKTGILCNADGPCETGKPGGMKVVNPTPEDSAILKRSLETAVLPDFAKRCGAECTTKWNATVGTAVNMKAVAK